jgi:hypothetical protein
VYLPYVIAIGVRGRAGFFRRGASVLNAPVLRQPLQRNVESLVLFGSTIECAPRSISGMKACTQPKRAGAQSAPYRGLWSRWRLREGKTAQVLCAARPLLRSRQRLHSCQRCRGVLTSEERRSRAKRSECVRLLLLLLQEKRWRRAGSEARLTDVRAGSRPLLRCGSLLRIG